MLETSPIHKAGRGVVWMLRRLWASPASAIGLAAGGFALLAGGGCRVRSGVLEFYGPGIAWLMARFFRGPRAMTLGHVVLGRTAGALDACRRHELVHVRQYERWGPAFLPAYLACSLALWIARRDPYLDNPFEVQAYRDAGDGCD